MSKIISTTTIILCSLSCILSSQSTGQWKNFSYTDGISSNYIFDVEKDQNGKIWIGTQNGITVFNGNHINKYGTAHGLPADNIIHIVSLHNTIYVATSSKGLYVKSNDGFVKSDIIQGNEISSMVKLSGNLFVSTNLENILYDGDKVSFMGRGFPNEKIVDIYSSNEKSRFASKSSIIKKEKKSFVTIPVKFPGSKTFIQAYLFDNGVEYFGTNNGLFSKKGKGALKKVNASNILAIAKHPIGSIYVGTKKGAFILDRGKVNNLNPYGEYTEQFISNQIQSIDIISESEVWYSTFGAGLFLQDPQTIQNISAKEIFPNGAVYDMAKHEDEIYIATANGLYSFINGKKNKHFTTKEGLPSNKILDIDIGPKGILWLATTKGLSRFDGKTFKNYSKKDGLPSSLVTAVHIDVKNPSIIWTGSIRNGLTRLDKNGFYTFAVQDGLPANNIQGIIQNKNGDLILANYNAGIVAFDGKNFILYDDNLDDKRIIAIEVGPNNEIWAGTESAGIGVLEGDSFRMIRDSDGLGHNEIFSLYFDGQKMWVGTFGGGVSCYSDGYWFTMNSSDGINGNSVGAVVSISKESVAIGGDKGISIFNFPDGTFQLGIDQIVTPKADISFLEASQTGISGITNDRFYINANPYYSKPTPSKIEYRTRIMTNGESGKWSAPKSTPQISFTSENVGSYSIEIQALESRVRFSNIVSISFNISRIWYLNPKTALPFWGSIILLIGFSTVTFINYQKKSKEAKELREAEIERQQAEMEEAREFQQAMLPKEMPNTPDYEMVGFQQTATEVGGDFFDFMKKKDGRWIAICGDATGHGLTSGNVVSITKTAMSALVEEEPVATLDSLNKTLLKMNIGLNRMCLNIANIGKDSIQFSSAGMPPAYHYSAETGTLEEILVGALPLGSFPESIHMMQEVPFKNKGDILIMMSDGLPEAENINDEMVGYERTEEEIRSLATKSVEEIKNGLVDLCDRWLDGHTELKDDMTFVIIKRK